MVWIKNFDFGDKYLILEICDSDGIDSDCVNCFVLKIYDSDGIDFVCVNCFVLKYEIPMESILIA